MVGGKGRAASVGLLGPTLIVIFRGWNRSFVFCSDTAPGCRI